MGSVTLCPLLPEDWEIFRAMRIRALRLHTGYFMANPDKSEEESVSHWHETLDGIGKQVLGLFDDEVLIGITGVFTCCKDPSGQTGVMAMSFIEPTYRGKGYSDLFYKARIDFAKNHTPWKKLNISHRKDNEPSRKAMIKNGFVFIGEQETMWPDGTQDTEYNYELDLEKLRSEPRG